MRQIVLASSVLVLVLGLGLHKAPTAEQDKKDSPPGVMQILKTLKQEGYKLEVETDFILNPDAMGKGVKVYLYIYKKDKASISLFRNSGGTGPGDRWQLMADKDPANRGELVSIAKKLSPQLGSAAEDSLKAFRKDGKTSIRKQVIPGVDLGINAAAFQLTTGL